MIYNRTSINYYVEIMFLRKLFRYALLPKGMPAVLSKLPGMDRWKLEEHRRLMIEKGRMTREEWVSINTDGPFCPLAKVYNATEAADLFKRFENVRQEIWEFNAEHWSFLGKLLPRPLERAIGRKWGWHRMVYARKPISQAGSHAARGQPGVRQ
jgi:hypothetical protein